MSDTGVTPDQESAFNRIASKFSDLMRRGRNSDEEKMAQTPNRKEALSSSISLAYSRPEDPMWYWRQNNIPFDIWNDPKALEKCQDYSRVLYLTHPVIGSAIDIYAKYPLSGMEIICPKDASLAEFYKTLFFDDLDYEQYLPSVGREMWMTGESFPLGSFNELMGVWEDDELIMPIDVIVDKTMFSRDPVLRMRLPKRLMDVLHNREPLDEYRRIVESYPELLGWVSTTDDPQSFFIVSNDVLYHFKRDADAFHERGLPILLRAFRAVVQEEMLNAAQDGIASRLYTPLILARIGASATDLGTTVPWIPSQADLDAFSESVNAALAADFRMITTHFAANIQSVFGREAVPDMSRDFERLEDKMLQAFGLSRTLLNGASGGETYAADALNRDMISQLLSEYQRKMRRFFQRRCEVVAEAQGHYDYEIKGGRPKPILEEFLETDPETGDQRISTRPKLLLPELRIKSMNMKDEEKFHMLLEELRAAGIPISQRARIQNVPIDLDDEAEAVIEEQVSQAVMAQRVRRETYIRLKAENLPIPEDLLDDFTPRAQKPPNSSSPQGDGAPTVGGTEGAPTLGQDVPMDDSALVPDPLDTITGGDPMVEGAEGEEMATELPRNRARPLVQFVQQQKHRPGESDEQRKDMPKASSLSQVDDDDLPDIDIDVVTSHVGMDDDQLRDYRAMGTIVTEDDDGNEIISSPDPAPLGSTRLAHVGLRHESIFWKRQRNGDEG